MKKFGVVGADPLIEGSTRGALLRAKKNRNVSNMVTELLVTGRDRQFDTFRSDDIYFATFYV